ncbi:hypothetical protein NQD34_018425 [Periophthalmus magnuspinnatus]|nr:hypothetical protein NQD34_018425 [Periophthalmus magnuspinnatus]
MDTSVAILNKRVNDTICLFLKVLPWQRLTFLIEIHGFWLTRMKNNYCITAMRDLFHRRQMKFTTNIEYVKTSKKLYYDPTLDPTGSRPLWPLRNLIFSKFDLSHFNFLRLGFSFKKLANWSK